MYNVRIYFLYYYLNNMKIIGGSVHCLGKKLGVYDLLIIMI